jgi:hypothetical protein
MSYAHIDRTTKREQSIDKKKKKSRVRWIYLVASGGDKDVSAAERVLERVDLVAVHGGLKRADRVDLGDDDARALAAQRLRTALADVAKAAHHCHFTADHHICRTVDAVDQRVAAAVHVVKLRLGHRVVDVDCREQQLAGLQHLIQAVHAGSGLLRHALELLHQIVKVVGVVNQNLFQDLFVHTRVVLSGSLVVVKYNNNDYDDDDTLLTQASSSEPSSSSSTLASISAS